MERPIHFFFYFFKRISMFADRRKKKHACTIVYFRMFYYHHRIKIKKKDIIIINRVYTLKPGPFLIACTKIQTGSFIFLVLIIIPVYLLHEYIQRKKR